MTFTANGTPNFRLADRLSGTEEYYFSKKLDEVRKLKSQGIDIINLGIGSPDLSPSQETLAAASLALMDPTIHGYAAYRSSPELRKGMAKWYQRTYGVALDADSQILPLLGSKEGILYTSLAFVNPGETILVPNPGYPAYAAVAQLIGARVKYYDLTAENDWLPDFKRLAQQDLSSCRLMWVNYPHMPTGKKGTPELFVELLAFAKAKNILIAHDNPYSLVLNEEAPLSILKFDKKMEKSLELNSFSKAFNMAGWRIGMVSAHKEVVNAILQVKSNVDSGMFAAIQRGAVAALDNSDQWHEERNAIYRNRRQVVWKIFDTLGFSYDRKQVGLFVWARAPESVSDMASFVDKILYEARVFIVPGQVFGSNGARYARSSLCAPVEVLNEALKRIQEWKSAQS